jgi:hypothetical protein
MGPKIAQIHSRAMVLVSRVMVMAEYLLSQSTLASSSKTSGALSVSPAPTVLPWIS